MYDLPGLRGANDAIWAALALHLRSKGLEAPERLTRDQDLEAIWSSPDLLLAQACGYPLAKRLAGLVQLVATPRYSAPGCRGSAHRAAVVVRADCGARGLEGLRGARCALNDAGSNTGMNLLRARIAPLAENGRFFGAVTSTGSHLASLAAVAEGRADVAAIDAVTLALATDLDPGLTAAVRVIGWTASSPGLPLVTAAAAPPEALAALRQALDAVAADPRLAPARRALRLTGFDRLSRTVYEAIPAFEVEAAKQGYPELA